MSTDAVSQRLLRKGALIEETYRAFQRWDLDASAEDNLKRLTEGDFKTAAWGREVRVTLQRRFRDYEESKPLIRLAAASLPIDEWRSCLLLWIGTKERLFGDFVRHWLFIEFEHGTYTLRASAVSPFLSEYWKEAGSRSPLSAYGELRTGRDLLRMARDFGLLEGDGPIKTLTRPHLSDRTFLFWAHWIAEREGSTSRVGKSSSWRLALMRPGDIEQELLRLHQFRKLDYQVAGSLVQLSLPCASSSEYAERMVA